MFRRDLLKMLASTSFGAGILAAGDRGSARAAAGPAASAKRAPAAEIETDDGTRLFLRDWGAGRPLVFVHGWSLASEAWQYQMIHLAGRGLRCVAYDRRGHGRSSDPGRGYDYDRLADDLAAVIEGLDLRHVVLVGQSMGAGDVVRYLARHGGRRVDRVVLVSPATPFLLKTADNPDGVDRRHFDAVIAKLCADLPKWMADNAAPYFLPETPPETFQWGFRMGYQASLKALVDGYRTLTETDLRPELRALKTPTVVIHGDRDHSAPLELTGRRTAALIPACELRVYEGAPHGLFITHMDRLNRDLEQIASS